MQLQLWEASSHVGDRLRSEIPIEVMRFVQDR
jgi:hypothetical protein